VKEGEPGTDLFFIIDGHIDCVYLTEDDEVMTSSTSHLISPHLISHLIASVYLTEDGRVPPLKGATATVIRPWVR
jgi:hypothetical protein